MNIFESIYYSQYYELKHSGRDPQKGRLNGTLLCAAVILLNLGSVIILLFKFAPHSYIALWVKRSTYGYENEGKMLGRLYGAILIVVIGGLLRYTIGTTGSYNRIAEKFSLLPDEVQKKTIRKSLIVFLVSFGLMLLLIFTK